MRRWTSEGTSAAAAAPMRARRWACVALAGLVGGVVGCGAAAPEALIEEDRVADLHRTLWDRTEELTADCMRGEGFDYVRRPFPGRATMLFAGSPFRLTEQEARDRGFGLVDNAVAGAAGRTVDRAADQEPRDEPRDPNEELKEALPAAQQRPWEVALAGSPDSPTPGCRHTAQAAADEEHAAEIEAVVTRVAQIGERVMADPRYHDMWHQWSRCMAGEGIDAPDLDTLQASLREAANALVTVRVPDDPTESAGSRPVEVEVDVAAADALRQDEIAAATASVRCLAPLEATFEGILDDALATAG